MYFVHPKLSTFWWGGLIATIPFFPSSIPTFPCMGCTLPLVSACSRMRCASISLETTFPSTEKWKNIKRLKAGGHLSEGWNDDTVQPVALLQSSMASLLNFFSWTLEMAWTLQPWGRWNLWVRSCWQIYVWEIHVWESSKCLDIAVDLISIKHIERHLRYHSKLMIKT